MLRPFDSNLSYNDSGDVTFLGNDFQLVESRSFLDFVLTDYTLSDAIERGVRNEEYSLYYKFDSVNEFIHFNDSDEVWMHSRVAGGTLLFSNTITSNTISSNIQRSIRNKRLTKLFGYKESDGAEMEWRQVDSNNASTFGDYVVFEKADAKFILFDQRNDPIKWVDVHRNLPFGSPPPSQLSPDYDSDIWHAYDSNVYGPNGIATLDSNYPGSYMIFPDSVDSVQMISLLRLREVDNPIGDGNQYYRFGFQIPIRKRTNELPAGEDSAYGFYKRIYNTMVNYVQDDHNFDFFRFTQDSNYGNAGSRLLTLISEGLDSADVPTRSNFQSLITLFNRDDYGQQNAVDPWLDSSDLLFRKFYIHDTRLYTHDIYSMSVDDSSKLIPLRDSGFARVNIETEYLIRIDSI